jgi:hypothetical protein
VKAATICRTIYRDAKGRFTKAPADAKAITLKNPRRQAGGKFKIVKASEGPKTKISGSGAPGKVYRVRLIDAEVNKLRREAKAQGGEFYKGFLQWEKEVKRANAAEAQKLLREMRERLRSQAMEAEFVRERASRGGKNAAKAKAEVKAKAEGLKGLSQSELLARLKQGSRADRKAVELELKRRGIEPVKRRRKK